MLGVLSTAELESFTLKCNINYPTFSKYPPAPPCSRSLEEYPFGVLPGVNAWLCMQLLIIEFNVALLYLDFLSSLHLTNCLWVWIL